MKYALTVMAHAAQPLPDTIIDIMDNALTNAGLNLEGVDILSEGLAIDGFFEADQAPQLDHTFADMAIDHAVTLVATRRKSLLIADMDSTIITSESLTIWPALAVRVMKLLKSQHVLCAVSLILPAHLLNA